jgi:hypothetical protein
VAKCRGTHHCHPPRRRKIQYAAADRIVTAVSGILLDHPPARVTTIEYDEKRIQERRKAQS